MKPTDIFKTETFDNFGYPVAVATFAALMSIPLIGTFWAGKEAMSPENVLKRNVLEVDSDRNGPAENYMFIKGQLYTLTDDMHLVPHDDSELESVIRLRFGVMPSAYTAPSYPSYFNTSDRERMERNERQRRRDYLWESIRTVELSDYLVSRNK